MPELPEVETIRRGLEKQVLDRRIVAVETSSTPLRGAASPRPLAELEGTRIKQIDRHAKFLLVRLDKGGTLLVHLGMSGKLLIEPRRAPLRAHTHVRLLLEDDRELRYVDPRRFGTVRLHADRDPPELAHYGIDALDKTLTQDRLAALLSSSRAPLKSFLLDQTKIAGLGNIYALEALWRARLSPRRIARNTPKTRVPTLLESIRSTLEDSMRNGGTTFNDYADTLGDPGGNLPFLAVFQREGEPCPRCGTPIKRIVQSGRSSFYCPECQR